jgi:hypothetical protein
MPKYTVLHDELVSLRSEVEAPDAETAAEMIEEGDPTEEDVVGVFTRVEGEHEVYETGVSFPQMVIPFGREDGSSDSQHVTFMTNNGELNLLLGRFKTDEKQDLAVRRERGAWVIDFRDEADNTPMSLRVTDRPHRRAELLIEGEVFTHGALRT